VFFAVFAGVFLVLWGALDLALPTIWRALQGASKRIASLSMRYGVVKRVITVASPFRDYLPVILTLVIGALLAVWAGDGFLDVAELVRDKSTTLAKTDTRIHDWAVERRYHGATIFFDTMSTVGGPVGVAVIGTAALLVLIFRKQFQRIGYLALTAGGGGALDWELKRYFARARPDVAEMLMRARGYSFPSGHAMGSTVVFGALAYLAFRALKQWRWKAAAIALATTLVLAVATSRVYLGVHWISDVGAGISAGLLWVTVTTVAYETFRRIHRIRLLRHEASSRLVTRGE
jgi:membrane-associated phospholipid phosphatase